MNKGKESVIPEMLRYKSLDATKGEIRLLDLKMSEDHDVECELTTTRLDEAPPFEASSYTWGSQENKLSIKLGGQSFEVTRNLHVALRHLRVQRTMGKNAPFQSHRKLWVDAQIYSQAARVLVWLGEEKDNSNLGMEMVRLLSLHLELGLQKFVKGRIGLSKESDNIPEDQGTASGTWQQEAEKEVLAIRTYSDKQDKARSRIQEKYQRETEGRAKDVFYEDETVRGSSEISRGKLYLVYMTEKQQLSQKSPDLYGPGRPRARSLDDIDRDSLGCLYRSNLSRPTMMNEEESSNFPLNSLVRLHGASDGAHIDPQDPEEWVAFQKLMKRPWWRRIWVVQEVAAARNMIWVGCGTGWLTWEMFVIAAKTIQIYENHPFFQRLARIGKDASFILDKARLRAQTDGRMDGWGGLLNILFDTRQYHATDPRDKLFALLGFTPSIGMVPDYKKSVEEVYEELVRLSISDTGCLAMIFLGSQPKTLQLPSWVPDFSLVLENDPYNVSCPLGFFGADGNNWQNIGVPSAGCALNIADERGQLTVFGFLYDHPLVIGSAWEGSSEEKQPRFFFIIDHYQRLLEETDSKHFAHLARNLRKESFWRTLIWNADQKDHYPAPANFGTLFNRLVQTEEALVSWKTLDVPKEKCEPEDLHRIIPPGEPQAYYEACLRHSFRRRFFITKKGHLGSGPPEMQTSDLICILLGAKTPVILRKSALDATYELVGHAYVHGIMHGEALGFMDHEVDDEGRRDIGIKEFCLV